MVPPESTLCSSLASSQCFSPILGAAATTATCAWALALRSTMWITTLSGAFAGSPRGIGMSSPRFHLPKYFFASVSALFGVMSPATIRMALLGT